MVDLIRCETCIHFEVCKYYRDAKQTFQDADILIEDLATICMKYKKKGI